MWESTECVAICHCHEATHIHNNILSTHLNVTTITLSVTTGRLLPCNINTYHVVATDGWVLPKHRHDWRNTSSRPYIQLVTVMAPWQLQLNARELVFHMTMCTCDTNAMKLLMFRNPKPGQPTTYVFTHVVRLLGNTECRRSSVYHSIAVDVPSIIASD